MVPKYLLQTTPLLNAIIIELCNVSTFLSLRIRTHYYFSSYFLFWMRLFLPLHIASCLWHRKRREGPQVGVYRPRLTDRTRAWSCLGLRNQIVKTLTCTGRIQPRASRGTKRASSNNVWMTISGSRYLCFTDALACAFPYVVFLCARAINSSQFLT